MTECKGVQQQDGLKAYTRDTVIEVYKKHQSIRMVTAETGCPPYTAFIWLKKAGILANNDSVRYGTPASRNGGMAEAEFRRLVPNAMPANVHLQQNCPAFDFDVNGWTVDVKFCGERKNGCFAFKTAVNKQLRPDFFCVFVCERGSIETGYKVLLIPEEFLSNQLNVSFRSGDIHSDEIYAFEVPAQDLAAVFESDKEV